MCEDVAMLQKRICRQCGRSFQGGPRAYYCQECREERRRERSRKYKQNGSARPLGSIDQCELCGKEYIVNGSLQRFCPECQPIHATEYDRATSLEFYGEHKARINPPRNERRRQGLKICEWCGNEFETHTVSKTCSAECRRKLKNKKWMERYYKH